MAVGSAHDEKGNDLRAIAAVAAWVYASIVTGRYRRIVALFVVVFFVLTCFAQPCRHCSPSGCDEASCMVCGSVTNQCDLDFDCLHGFQQIARSPNSLQRNCTDNFLFTDYHRQHHISSSFPSTDNDDVSKRTIFVLIVTVSVHDLTFPPSKRSLFSSNIFIIF